MTAKSLRTETFAQLNALGFQPATSLPLPRIRAKLRPVPEIAARLMALDAVFTWVAFLPKHVTSKRIRDYIDRNHLRDWMTEEERAIVDLSRKKANEDHDDSIGWRLENMWPLAWVLGYEPEPDLEAAQISEEITRPLFHEFFPGLGGTIAMLVAKSTPRAVKEVIALEYRFYCAHNAVRSAQLGGKTVPPGFHPIVHGGVVHERRQALTWCLSPEVAWEETDLST
ncbi:MAG: DUF4272 domain-containing protein [Gemmataceae bacterium]